MQSRSDRPVRPALPLEAENWIWKRYERLRPNDTFDGLRQRAAFNKHRKWITVPERHGSGASD
jgi:hypothetical protein